MRFIPNDYFQGVEPFMLDNGSADTKHRALIGEVIYHTICAYRPFPGRTLGITGIRAYNRLRTAFKDEAAKEYSVQEDDWVTLLTVMEWTLPRVTWFRQAPAVMDMLAGMKD